MKKRGCILIVLCLANIIINTGCWNYREINNLSIVSGVAVDKNEDGKYRITTEIVDLHEGGKDAGIKSKKLESYGDTLFDAVRNTLEVTAGKLYWGHVEIVIFSQDVAKEGVVQFMDFLVRDSEPRQSVDILISREKTAGEIFNFESSTTEIRSHEINEMLDTQKNLSKTTKVQVYEFINALSDEGICAVMPVVGSIVNEGKKDLELSGTAVFKQDKLVYMLNGDETKLFLYVMDKIKGGLLIIKDTTVKNKNSKLTLEIIKSKTKIKPVFIKGKLTMNIDIETKAALGQEGESERRYNEKINLMLQKDAEETLKRDIENLITNVKKNTDSDIFGFGRVIMKDKPDLWKKIGADWDDTFKKLDVKLNIDVDIQNSGLMSTPIRIGD